MGNFNGQSSSGKMNPKKPSVSFSDLVDASTNNKSNLSILEENSDRESLHHQSVSAVNSSNENVSINIKTSQEINGSRTHSSNRLHDLPEPAHTQRRPSAVLYEILRRPSIITAMRRPSLLPRFNRSRRGTQETEKLPEPAIESRRKNRRIGNDALSTALSALYAKVIVIMGIAFPVTEILSSRLPPNFYKGFYVYLYTISILFVIFIYVSHYRTKAVYTIINNYDKKNSQYNLKKRAPHFGSFYLRVGAIAFGIGTMVYSGLEFGQYFELKNNSECNNILIAITPIARMLLSIIMMQFIFLNTTQLDMARHKVIARFGLMHMIATNLCEWLYVLVEETKHEIFHLAHHSLHSEHLEHAANGHAAASLQQHETNDTNHHSIHTRSIQEHILNHSECSRTNIMGSLVQNASPFLFPCTIEYSLICAVILYEMWKKVRSIPKINKERKSSLKNHQQKSAHQFSIDCSRAHRGMFAGIIVIVLTIIVLIMYFVLHNEPDYEHMARLEVTYYEILIYTVCTLAVFTAMYRMRDLRFQKKQNDHHASTVKLDCTLLVLAQIGVFVYAMFSILGSFFTMQDEQDLYGRDGLIAEILSLVQCSTQTLFILNSVWRRCRGAQQNREKPGRQIVTFLLVANISMWFVNTLIKGHASFRPSHLVFYGKWAWTIITHLSMPLAIFYRFHSTICLFDVWKAAYKFKVDH